MTEPTTTKNIIDGVSVGVSVAALAGWLPTIAAILSLVYTAIRIYESRTVQRWLYGATPKIENGGDDV